MPAVIYREGYWYDQTKVVGYQSNKNDKICMIYDLSVTGRGLKHVASFFNNKESKEGIGKITDAIVFFDYDESGEAKKILAEEGVNLDSILCYKDYISEIERLKKNPKKATEHFKPISKNGRALSPSERVKRPFGKEQETMKQKAEVAQNQELPKWYPSLYAYKKVALKFKTKEDFSKAMGVVCEEERGMPYDLVGFETVIIPENAVEYFSGLKFKIIKVVPANEIPSERLAVLRKANLG